MQYDVRSKLTLDATVEVVERGRLTLRLRPGFDISTLVKFIGAENVLVTLCGDTPVNDELRPETS